MEDTKLLETVERYIRGEMKPDERLQFEQLRKTQPEIDQLVVEHTLFLQQLNHFGERRHLRTTLHEVHTDLTEQGKIDSMKLRGRAKVVYLFKRYKRVAAIAAVIAGVTTLGITAIVNTVSGKAENARVTELVSKVDRLDQKTRILDTKIDHVDKKNTRPIISTPVRYNGTGFLIDAKGYLVTNAHVVKNSKNLYIQNNRGEQYGVKVVKLDLTRDIAILKITDENYKPGGALPYGIRRSGSDIAEPIYTLGFPRNEIVYGEGYLSAKTGYNGDTLSCQIAVAANPGNSGGPVFNQQGEVIGILSTKEVEAEGAVFAVQSRFIFEALDELKKDTSFNSLRLPQRSSVRNLSKQEQVRRIQDYVFMVKGD